MPADLHAIADRYVPRFADTFRFSAESLREKVTQAMVEEDMARGIRAHPKSLYELIDSMVIAKEVATDPDVERLIRQIVTAVGTANGVVMDLDSPFVLEAAKTLTADLVTNVNKETKAAIRQMIFEAIRDGDAPAEAQKYIRQVIGLTKRDAMTVKRMMALDPSKADRLAAKLLRRRAITIARTECLLPETPVDAAVVRAVHRRWYSGPVVEVTTVSGRKFTATPNHPMLTQAGWLPLQEVAVGDDLIRDPRNQYAGATGNPNVKGRPSTISEVFDAAAAVGVVERVPCGKPDFHGDGIEGEVEIASPYRELAVGEFTPLGEPLVNLLFAPSDAAALAAGHPSRSLRAVDERVDLSWAAALDTPLAQYAAYGVGVAPVLLGQTAGWDSGLIGGGDLVAGQVMAIVGGLAAALYELIPGISKRAAYAALLDELMDGTEVRPNLLGNLSAAHSREIELDNVVSKRFRPWSGHVYNLSTPHGYFAANHGYLTGNTMRASNMGQRATWQQMVADGMLDPDTARSVWIVTDDDRLCPDCATMEGETTEIDGSFTQTERGVLPSERVPFDGPTVESPPLHPSCRCTTALEFDD